MPFSVLLFVDTKKGFLWNVITFAEWKIAHLCGVCGNAINIKCLTEASPPWNQTIIWNVIIGKSDSVHNPYLRIDRLDDICWRLHDNEDNYIHKSLNIYIKTSKLLSILAIFKYSKWLNEMIKQLILQCNLNSVIIFYHLECDSRLCFGCSNPPLPSTSYNVVIQLPLVIYLHVFIYFTNIQKYFDHMGCWSYI